MTGRRTRQAARSSCRHGAGKFQVCPSNGCPPAGYSPGATPTLNWIPGLAWPSSIRNTATHAYPPRAPPSPWGGRRRGWPSLLTAVGQENDRDNDAPLEVGSIVVRHASGQVTRIPLRYNVNCLTSSRSTPGTTPTTASQGQAEVVHVGASPDGRQMSLYAINWHNKMDDKMIESVSLETCLRPTATTPVLLAVSTMDF